MKQQIKHGEYKKGEWIPFSPTVSNPHGNNQFVTKQPKKEVKVMTKNEIFEKATKLWQAREKFIRFTKRAAQLHSELMAMQEKDQNSEDVDKLDADKLIALAAELK